MSKLSFLAAFLMTVAISAIVMLYDEAKNKIEDLQVNGPLLFAVSFILIFAITIIGIELLFNFYAKKQIKLMAESLPDNIVGESDSIGFKELGERITGLQERSDAELDMLKEMEIYRKEYIGNVSHELKTPLFSIQGYVETLIDGAIENIPIRDKYLKRIDFSVERLLAIVKDLDMINQFESGEINLQVTKFDINLLIREVFDLLDLEAQKRSANLKMVFSQSAIFVEADKQKITQVLINLVSNAVHYANRQEATIIVSTSVLKNKVLIEVEDNGMGIKSENLPRIFERFYRVEASRNRKDGGSGLGLAIVKHILEAHQENISVESTYLEGTKFSFLLNRAL